MRFKFQRSYKPDNEYIRLQLVQQNIQWSFNPPLATQFGGVWERVIQTESTYSAGQSETNTLKFPDSCGRGRGNFELQTINVGCSISDEGPLTPNHFLLRRPHKCLKPLVNSNQRFSTKDFKLTRTLLDHYWSRLLKEHIPELNKRTKWQR